MAALTVRTEFTPMHVVTAVTAATSLGHVESTLRGTLVTDGASNSRVATIELERGLPVVIERPQRPLDRIVAIAAGGTERHPVFVVLAMAIDALTGCILETRGLVTIGACDRAVSTDQGKARQAVIEHHRLGPAAFAVTFRACTPELPRVRIVVPVTTEAIAGRACRFDRGLVATRTLDLNVRTGELKIGIASVIETHHGPCLRRVATAAVTPVQAMVFVIIAMARITITRQGNFEYGAGVTVGATCIEMLTG
jgi:hypothetical protein